MAKKMKCLHKYKKIKLGTKGYTVFKCMKPMCSHYIRQELVEGNACECWRCGEIMVMDKLAMTLAKPHCFACTERKKNKDVDKLSELFADV